MACIPPTADGKEERRVQFCGLDWLEEEQRAAAGAKRRKDARERRKLQNQKEEQSRLDKIMAETSDIHQFFQILATKGENEEVFNLDFANAALEVARQVTNTLPGGPKSEIISKLLNEWGLVEGERELVRTIKEWMGVSILAGLHEEPIVSEDAEHQGTLGRHLLGRPPLASRNISADNGSLELSGDSEIGPMDEGLKKKFKEALAGCDLLVVIDARYRVLVAKKTVKRRQDARASSLTFVRSHLQGHPALDQWDSIPMYDGDRVLQLAPVLEEYVRRFEPKNVDEKLSPIKKNPQSM